MRRTEEAEDETKELSCWFGPVRCSGQNLLLTLSLTQNILQRCASQACATGNHLGYNVVLAKFLVKLTLLHYPAPPRKIVQGFIKNESVARVGRLTYY